MIVRVLIVAFGLFFCHCSFAEWRLVTGMVSGPMLLQKDISSNKGKPIVAIVCVPEPTLIVKWLENHPDISVSIDTVRLDVPKQISLRNGNQAITLKPAHLQGLIKGLDLQLKSTLPSGEKITAKASLLGFSSQFKKANMDCST